MCIRDRNDINENRNFSSYPNPFYVNEGYNYVRFIFDYESNSNTQLDIYDFSMKHIVNINNIEEIGSSGQFLWDGRDKYYNQVSNGVYFCRLKINQKYYWTKLMVIK